MPDKDIDTELVLITITVPADKSNETDETAQVPAPVSLAESDW